MQVYSLRILIVLFCDWVWACSPRIYSFLSLGFCLAQENSCSYFCSLTPKSTFFRNYHEDYYSVSSSAKSLSPGFSPFTLFFRFLSLIFWSTAYFRSFKNFRLALPQLSRAARYLSLVFLNCIPPFKHFQFLCPAQSQSCWWIRRMAGHCKSSSLSSFNLRDSGYLGDQFKFLLISNLVKMADCFWNTESEFLSKWRTSQCEWSLNSNLTSLSCQTHTSVLFDYWRCIWEEDKDKGRGNLESRLKMLVLRQRRVLTEWRGLLGRFIRSLPNHMRLHSSHWLHGFCKRKLRASSLIQLLRSHSSQVPFMEQSQNKYRLQAQSQSDWNILFLADNESAHWLLTYLQREDGTAR